MWWKRDEFPSIFPLGFYIPKPERIPPLPDSPTKLNAYLKRRGIKPAHLAKESGYSRQHILRLRMGRMEPTRRCMAAIVSALQRLSGEYVVAEDFWDLGALMYPTHTNVICACSHQKREHWITSRQPKGPCQVCGCRTFTPEPLCKCGHGKKAHENPRDNGRCHHFSYCGCKQFREAS